MKKRSFARFKIKIMSQTGFLAILSKKASKIIKKKKLIYFLKILRDLEISHDRNCFLKL